MNHNSTTHRLALAEGTQVHHYRLERILGFGGFGITYAARDLELCRQVAIKELLPSDFATREGTSVTPKTENDLATFRWALERFISEAQILAACHHETIVAVHEIFQANGTGYMVTEYLDGEHLADWLNHRNGPPSEELLHVILGKLLSGLEIVHAKGFLHRDIKPENIIMIQQSDPVLIDFGSARLAVGGKTRAMTAVLTPSYAPFEQYHESGDQGAWTDIYSLGAVMFRAMTGQAPPEAPLRAKRGEELNLTTATGGHFSAEFVDAIEAALEVDEEDRPQNVTAWRQLLDGASSRKARTVRKTRMTTRKGRPKQPSRGIMPMVAMLVTLVAVIGGALAWWLLPDHYPFGRRDNGMESHRDTYKPGQIVTPPPISPVAGSSLASSLRNIRQSAVDLVTTIRNERDRADDYMVDIKRGTGKPRSSSQQLTSLQRQAKATSDEVDDIVSDATASLKAIDALLEQSRQRPTTPSDLQDARDLLQEVRDDSTDIAGVVDSLRRLRQSILDEINNLLASQNQPAGSTPPTTTPPATPQATTQTDPADAVRAYALAYLAAGDSGSGDNQLRFFANRASYFDYGYLYRSEISGKLNAYNSQWTTRQHQVLSQPVVQSIGGDKFSVTLRARFYVSDGATSKHVTGTNRFEIKTTRNDDYGFMTLARIDDAATSYGRSPPASSSPGTNSYEVVYTGSEGVSVRSQPNSAAAQLGAAFRQSSVPLPATGEVDGRWVKLRLRGWMVAKGRSTSYMTFRGGNRWQVNQNSDGVLSMRAEPHTNATKVANLSSHVSVTGLEERYVDGKKWVRAELTGWMATRLSSSGKTLLKAR